MSVHGLPSSTEIKKLVHKKLLYAKFPKELCGERRKQFDDDIGRIVVTNEISPVSVNIKEGEQVKSIFVLQVELKTKAYNERNIVLISKLFGQHLLIVLKYADEVQLATYQTRLLKILIGAVKDKDALILDFFSGSATTAHATMQLNREDGGNRQYIMVQIPDGIDEKSEAYKDGYHNLCEIGKERIRLAGAEIKEADIGFRVLKLDSSNMKDIYYNPAQIQQQSLFDSTDNIKEDRTPEDLLFQVMLDLGILLSSKIEEKTIAGKKVFNVADGFLIACFDNDVTEKTVKAVAQEKPYYAVFRDSSMANDSVATNFEQIFATYSPETVRKVL